MYWETDFPWMSAMLFYLANRRWMADLEAEESMKLTFLPMFAKDAISRKNYGKARADTSMNMDTLMERREKQRHFFTSASKFFPNLAAKRMAPMGPNTSFSTHWKAAAAMVACA